MANPAVVEINTEWTWQKVATGITMGSIHLVNRGTCYFRTYRMTGESAPDNPSEGTIPDEAIQIFLNKIEELIRNNEASDIYLFCKCSNRKNPSTGKVVIDS